MSYYKILFSDKTINVTMATSNLVSGTCNKNFTKFRGLRVWDQVHELPEFQRVSETSVRLLFLAYERLVSLAFLCPCKVTLRVFSIITGDYSHKDTKC